MVVALTSAEPLGRRLPPELSSLAKKQWPFNPPSTRRFLSARAAAAWPSPSCPGGTSFERGLGFSPRERRRPADEAVLKSAKVETTNDALVDFFRNARRRLPLAKIDEIVKKLSAKDGGDRDLAQSHLTAIGLPTAPLCARSPTTSMTGTRVREPKPASSTSKATGARHRHQRGSPPGGCKPPAAAEVLIAYLPYAEDDMVYEEIEAALIAVCASQRQGRSGPVEVPARYILASSRCRRLKLFVKPAAASITRPSVPFSKTKARPVRLRAALGLVNAFDSEAVPVLIDLLGDLPPVSASRPRTT